MDMIKKYFNEIVGILSFITTTFFGIYGITYSIDAEYERGKQSNKELIIDVQEQVFNNKTIDCQDISTLIRGKELKNNITYRYSIKDLLIQCQEIFFDTKYLQIDKRKALFEKIDSLRIANNDCINLKISKSRTSFFANMNAIKIISILALLISILIAINLFSRIRERIRKDYQNKFTNYEEQLPKLTSDGLKYELSISNIFNKLGIEVLSREKGKDFGVDFKIKTIDKEFLVEAKFVKQNVTLSTLKVIFEIVEKSGMDLILISNRIMNFETFSALSEFNEKSRKGKIYYISAYTDEQLEKEIRKITNA